MDSPAVGMVKLGLRITGSLGAAKIVGAIIRNNVTVETNAQKVQVFVAQVALSGIIGDAIEGKVSESVDDAVDFFGAAKDAIQEYRAQQEKDTPEQEQEKDTPEQVEDTPETTGP